MVCSVPEVRVLPLNKLSWEPEGDFVLYWMVAYRRPYWNFALQHAVEQANALGKPLVILEALRCDYDWASARFHAYILEGMRDNKQTFASSAAMYFPFVECVLGEGKGLLKALAARSCGVVSDAYPGFFIPRMQRLAAETLGRVLELVDSNGLLPLQAAEKTYTTAYSFRRFLHKKLPEHILELPMADPLSELTVSARALDLSAIFSRWSPADDDLMSTDASNLSRFPVNHEVHPVKGVCGGWKAANVQWEAFLEERLEHYEEARNHPDDRG
ncbi:MAG: deoxyribodipyrimidine photolyase, partial [Myxococcota bacterium]